MRVVEHKKPRESQKCEFTSASVRAAAGLICSSQKVHVELLPFCVFNTCPHMPLPMGETTLSALPRPAILILVIFHLCEQPFFVCSDFM